MSYGNRNSDSYFSSNSGRSVGRSRYAEQRLEEPVVPQVEEPKVQIDPTSRDLICFKGRYYVVDLLRKQTGPEIQVKTEELADDIENAAKESRPMSEEIQNLKPVFAKYEGKYVVLLGLKAVLDQLRKDGHNATIKGRLLSNPVLKRCVIG